MINGLWTVEFISTIKRYGKGVIIINDERILGGDDGYYYSGKGNVTGNKIEAIINCIKYDQNSISIFGNIDHFQLKIQGEIDEYQLKAKGTIINNPQAVIEVVGTKREDL